MANRFSIKSSHDLKVSAPQVKNYWEMICDSHLNENISEEVLPSINSDLIFIRKGGLIADEKRVDESFISPVLLNYKNIEFEPGTHLFGIRLNPVYSRIVLQQNPDGLLQGPNLLKYVLPDWINHHLEGILAENRGFTETIQKLDAFFLEFFSKSEKRESETALNCLSYISRNMVFKVQDLSRATGFTERWLEKLFQRHIGIKPSEAIHISRFNRLLHAINKKTFSNLTEAGYHSGYADQSHMIRDFKKFTSTTPKHYVNRFPEFIEIMNCR